MELNRSIRGAREAEALVDGGYYRWRTPVPHPFYNGVVCSDRPGDDAAERAASTVAYFRDHKVASFIWWQDSPEGSMDWAPILREHGFVLDETLPGMAAELPALTVPRDLAALDIRHVADLATLET